MSATLVLDCGVPAEQAALLCRSEGPASAAAPSAILGRIVDQSEGLDFAVLNTEELGEADSAAGHLGVVQGGSCVPGIQLMHHVEAAHGLDETRRLLCRIAQLRQRDPRSAPRIRGPWPGS